MGSRERIRRIYSRNQDEYDAYRTVGFSGRTFKRHRLDAFTRSLPDDPTNCRTLEVAAGTGVYTLPVLRRGFSLTAADVNQNMLDVLRTKLAEEGLASRCTIRTEDLFELSFPDRCFDFVYCMSLLPRFSDLEDQRDGLLELARVLDRGGRLVFNYRNRSCPTDLLGDGRGATSSQIAEILRAGGVGVIREQGAGLVSLAHWRKLPQAALALVNRVERALEDRPRLFRNILVVAEKRA